MLVTKCLSSAAIGYEKPHPGAFHIALEIAQISLIRVLSDRKRGLTILDPLVGVGYP